MSEPINNGHGGKRPGAGRKKATDPLATYHVDITPAQASLLKGWGGGDISAGLRWLIDAASILVRKPTRKKLECTVLHDLPPKT